MGQKANPVSLRLKTTNKSFDSCWYSDLHYSTLLSLELKVRSYIEKVFEQIRYPRPLISLSLIPKRGKVLMFYLNPERLRGQRNERFQLKPYMPPRNVESPAHYLPTRSREASDMLGLGGGVGTLKLLLVKGSLLHGEPHSSSWKPEINQVQSNRPWERASASYKQGGWMPNWERRLFIYSTLLSITKSRSNTARLLVDKDFALFYRVQCLVWFQGRGESCLSSTNRPLPIDDSPAGKRLLRANRSRGRGTPFSRSRGSLPTPLAKGSMVGGRGMGTEPHTTADWGRGPIGHRGGSYQVGKPSSRRNSLGRGSYTISTSLARGLQTWCARGLPRGLTGWVRSPTALALPPAASTQLPHQMSNLIKRKRDIICWVDTNTRAIRSMYTTTSFSGPTELVKEVEARSSAGHPSFSPSKKRGWRGGHTAEPVARRRALVSEIGVKSKRLDGMRKRDEKGAPHHSLWPKPLIREIRREDAPSSIYLMEVALGVGLGVSTTIYPYKSIEEEQTAQFLSEEIAYYLEHRIPFRRIKQALMRELEKKYIEGIKVSCSGRVGGRSKKAQRSREESFQWGQTSSHVFSSKLSFASRSALTPFGKVGIKVWICYK